jgi:hypothetical protein
MFPFGGQQEVNGERYDDVVCGRLHQEAIKCKCMSYIHSYIVISYIYYTPL